MSRSVKVVGTGDNILRGSTAPFSQPNSRILIEKPLPYQSEHGFDLDNHPE